MEFFRANEFGQLFLFPSLEGSGVLNDLNIDVERLRSIFCSLGFNEGQQLSNVVTVRYDVSVADVVLRMGGVDCSEEGVDRVVWVPHSVLAWV